MSGLVFEGSVAPPAADPADPTPLGSLPAGDYALLAWLDDLHARHRFGPATEAEIVARWDTASLRDVHDLVLADADAAAAATAASGSNAPDPDLSSVRALLAAEVARGLETGVQLSISFQGRRADIAVGDNGAGAPLTADTAVPWTCSSKPLGALAFAAAWQDGALDLDTPVHTVLPEFAGGGKEHIRVRDLLSHTTGMADPMMAIDPASADVSSLEDIDALIWKTVCAAEISTAPGTAMEYNPVSNWFVLDRMLGAVGGGEAGDSYRRLFGRLGLSCSLGLDWGLPPEAMVTAIAAPDQQAGLEAMQLAAMLPLPGVGVWGTMRDLRVVGETLLNRGAHAGASIAGPAYVEALSATRWPGTPVRDVPDADFEYGLGVMTQPLVLGRRCSARVFGHAGGNNSTLLVDPLFDLVLAVFWNGRQNNVKTVARRYALVRALYADLGLPRLPITAAAHAAVSHAEVPAP